MAAATDIWFVRLPNGRVLRSSSTVSLRYQVRKGRIPAESRVRRSEGEPWHALHEVQELAEAVEAAAARTSQDNGSTAVRRKSRAHFQAWRTVGVRGVVRELLDALDSSLSRTKLGIAAVLATLGSVAWIAWQLFADRQEEAWWKYAVGGLAAVFVLAACLGITLVTRHTAFELSRMRAPSTAELWSGVLVLTLRLAVALLLVVGGGAALIALLRWLPQWIRAGSEAGNVATMYLAHGILTVRLILEVVFWPVVALAPLLLGPILIVQESSVVAGIREWWRILRQHMGRIFLYEALATALGGVFTVPLLAPIALASSSLASMSGQELIVGQTTVLVLAGIALTPLVAYLLVANVFIYLNLRYEFFHSAR